MSKAQTLSEAEISARRPLLQGKDSIYYVPVSHKELDDLIGRMMQIFEMNGDVEQRRALKQETKWRCREWLDNLYANSGYEFHEVKDNTTIVRM